MNLLDLRTDLRLKLGSPSTSSVTDTRLNQLLNRAMRQIADRYRFRNARRTATWDTVVGTSRYNLPADCLVIHWLRDTETGVKLFARDEEWAVRQPIPSSGKPTDYVRRRDWIELYPTPDDVVTMDLTYKASLSDLVSDTDVPMIPDVWHEGIPIRARWIYYDDLGDLSKALASINTWKEWVADKPTEVDDEKFFQDSGVQLPTFKKVAAPRNDFFVGDF